MLILLEFNVMDYHHIELFLLLDVRLQWKSSSYPDICISFWLMNIALQHSGDDGSGKTTLMTKLQGVEHNKKGRGLEYLYLNVHDEDRDGKAVEHCSDSARYCSVFYWDQGLE